MEPLPFLVYLLFGLTLLLAVYLFYKASGKSAMVLWVLLSLVILQSVASIAGFYTKLNTSPPRFLLLPLPPVIAIVFLLSIPSFRRFPDRLNISTMTLFHIIRVPVELVLYWLFTYKAVPRLMTFAGGNLDILSGLTAPLVYYFGFVRQRLNKWMVLAWNLVCLALLANIVARAVLSLPTGFQQLAFDQPNIAVLYFPFTLLPGCIVPMVLLFHLAALRQLVSPKYSMRGVNR